MKSESMQLICDADALRTRMRHGDCCRSIPSAYGSRSTARTFYQRRTPICKRIRVRFHSGSARTCRRVFHLQTNSRAVQVRSTTLFHKPQFSKSRLWCRFEPQTRYSRTQSLGASFMVKFQTYPPLPVETASDSLKRPLAPMGNNERRNRTADYLQAAQAYDSPQ